MGAAEVLLNTREQELWGDRVDGRVGHEQCAQFGKAAGGVKPPLLQGQQDASICLAKIVRVSDDAVEAVELAGDNAVLGAGGEFGGGMGEFDNFESVCPALVKEAGGEGEGVAGASGADGDVKERDSGSRGGGGEGESGGVDAPELREVGQGL